MVALTKRLSKRLLVAGLIAAGSIVFVLRASALPQTGPPNFRPNPPTQPATPALPSRQVDDNRFIRPNDLQNQANASGTSGNGGLAGGSNGFGNGGSFGGGSFAGGGAGGGGGGSGGFFGMARFGKMPKVIPGDPMNAGEPTFHGTFNFGGFKGYGFGGGDMSSYRNSERQPMSGGASHSEAK